MKWDVKHDKAKRVIDMFLEGADSWQKTGEFVVPNRRDLTGDLTDEDKALVSEEVATMIASIRKRYKLQERLLGPAAGTVPAVEPEVEPVPEAATESVAEVKPEEPAEAASEPEKPKRGRKTSTGEKKAATRRKKKEVQEEEQA